MRHRCDMDGFACLPLLSVVRSLLCVMFPGASRLSPASLFSPLSPPSTRRHASRLLSALRPRSCCGSGLRGYDRRRGIGSADRDR